VRGWPDLALLVLGVVVLTATASVIHQHRVSAAETAVFRAINDHTVVPFVVAWPVMQLGNFFVIPVAALAAAATRRWRLSLGLLIGGLAHGLGFVSGHTAVATALAAIAWPYLGRRWRAVVVIAAVLVALARVYVGAHLPLDVLGGAALGLAVAGLVRLILGRPAAQPLNRKEAR
jgi:undecaprenyl-diphosphatase